MQAGCGGAFFRVTDPVRIYHLNYWIYVLTGFWTYESRNQWKETLFRAYQFLLVFVYGFTISSFFVEAISVRHDLDKLSFNLTSSVLVFITAFKVSMLRRKRATLESVLRSLENNLDLKTIGESAEDKEIFRRRAELILNLSRVFYTLLVVCYSLRVLADTALGTRAYLIPMPYQDNLERHYPVIYAQQVIIVSHFLVTVIAHDLLIYGVINRLIAHFEVLENNFLRVKSLHPRINFEEHVTGYREQSRGANDLCLLRIFFDEVRNASKKPARALIPEAGKAYLAKQLLTDSIQHHQKLLKEIISFSKIYSQPFVIQVFGTILLLGIVAVKILLLSNKVTPLLVQQVLYVAITLLNNHHLCSFASELTTKSLAAADALYDIPWYEMDVKNRRILNFTLKNLMAEPKLKGGDLIVINRVTYLKMLRTSYNMVVVLRNLY